MKIPQSNRNKALFVVDVQSAFIDEHSDYIIKNILKLLNAQKYQAYVVATFHAGKGSLWDIQQQWTSPREDTDTRLASVLKGFQPMLVEKGTRSVFKSTVDVESLLRAKEVEEVHVVGTQTNDCILATALDAFDRGFIPYVIEECCEAATKELQEAGLLLLRRQNMTNNSFVERVPSLTI